MYENKYKLDVYRRQSNDLQIAHESYTLELKYLQNTYLNYLCFGDNISSNTSLICNIQEDICSIKSIHGNRLFENTRLSILNGMAAFAGLVNSCALIIPNILIARNTHMLLSSRLLNCQIYKQAPTRSIFRQIRNSLDSIYFSGEIGSEEPDRNNLQQHSHIIHVALTGLNIYAICDEYNNRDYNSTANLILL